MISALLTLAQAAVEAAPAAEAAGPGRGVGLIGIGIGMGLVVLGAGLGIGRIGGQACEAIARQPEAGGRIGTNMIIAAALIEGVSFFSVIMLFLST